MELDGMTGRFLRISEVIAKMAYVNLLWILFTVLGLGLFGLMPATVGLFSVTRKWVIGEKDIPVFATFWKNYRKEFFNSNLLGIILFAIGYILYVDLTYLPTDGILFTIIRGGLIVCGLLFLIILLYIFPVYVHYKWNKRMYLKYALLLGASYPHFTLCIFIGMAVLYFALIAIPGLIPFFSISILSYIIMWISYKVIQKVEELQAAQLN